MHLKGVFWTMTLVDQHVFVNAKMVALQWVLHEVKVERNGRTRAFYLRLPPEYHVWLQTESLFNERKRDGMRDVFWLAKNITQVWRLVGR